MQAVECLVSQTFSCLTVGAGSELGYVCAPILEFEFVHAR
jgi:hypothetical protein